MANSKYPLHSVVELTDNAQSASTKDLADLNGLEEESLSATFKEVPVGSRGIILDAETEDGKDTIYSVHFIVPFPTIVKTTEAGFKFIKGPIDPSE